MKYCDSFWSMNFATPILAPFNIKNGFKLADNGLTQTNLLSRLYLSLLRPEKS